MSAPIQLVMSLIEISTSKFLASNPTPQQIRDFRPTPEMLERLRILISKSKTGDLTTHELGELDEYERIEHLIVMLKSGNLRFLNR